MLQLVTQADPLHEALPNAGGRQVSHVGPQQAFVVFGTQLFPSACWFAGHEGTQLMPSQLTDPPTGGVHVSQPAPQQALVLFATQPFPSGWKPMAQV